MIKHKEIVLGDKIGLLTVLKISHHVERRGRVLWSCKCDCGVDVSKSTEYLRSSKKASCGCQGRTSKSICINSLKERYKYSASERQQEYSLSIDHFAQLVTGDCYYCGTPPSRLFRYSAPRSKPHEMLYNGIDRKSNKIGYTPVNSLTCCWICNQAKSNMEFDEFIDWVGKIANRLKMIAK